MAAEHHRWRHDHLKCKVNRESRTFPGGSVVKTLPANAGDTNPWSRKIPQASGQLTHALQQEQPLQWEACPPQLDSRPCSPQLEKICAQQRRPRTAKKKINFIFLEKREAMSEFKERMCPVQLWMSIIGKVLGKSGECTGHISPPIVKKQANGDTFLKQGGKYSHHY